MFRRILGVWWNSVAKCIKSEEVPSLEGEQMKKMSVEQLERKWRK